MTPAIVTNDVSLMRDEIRKLQQIVGRMAELVGLTEIDLASPVRTDLPLTMKS